MENLQDVCASFIGIGIPLDCLARFAIRRRSYLWLGSLRLGLGTSFRHELGRLVPRRN